MSDEVVRIDGLRVVYPNGYRALEIASLSVGRGETVGVVGASGSGKSTLLRAMLGLLPRGSHVDGMIEIGGRDVTALGEPERRALRGTLVGYVAQDPFAACDPLRRVRHHVEEAWAAHGERPGGSLIDDRLARIGIADPAPRSRQRPHQWSGGMLQRATTVAATAHDPVVTLADEPSSALDAEVADQALELLREACTSLVVVTHDLALAARHTDRLVVLDRGRVVEAGASRVLLTAPRHDVTRRLVRASAPQPRTSAKTVASGELVVVAQGIAKSYESGGRTISAVRPVDVTVRAGEVTGILGASGSGKSTLLRLLSGMDRPDAGSVTFGSAAAWGRGSRPRLSRLGFAMPIFQDPVGSLDPRWPLWRSITEPLVLAQGRMSRRERRRRAQEALEEVGLGDIDPRRRPGSLSVGQCQRVAVVRALIAQPALLAADEPTASLDVEAAEVVGAMLRSAADAGAAVIVVSHDEARLRSYADRIVRMSEGRLSDDGSE